MPLWLFALHLLLALGCIILGEPAYAILPIGLAIALNGQPGLFNRREADDEPTDTQTGEL